MVLDISFPLHQIYQRWTLGDRTNQTMPKLTDVRNKASPKGQDSQWETGIMVTYQMKSEVEKEGEVGLSFWPSCLSRAPHSDP